MAAEASDADAVRTEPTVQVVEFTVAGERFAVDVGDVDSIEELRGATRVPRTGDAIAGVMDLRGEITAIIDPRVHLDVGDDDDDHGGVRERQVLVLDQSKDKQKLGLQVDSVDGVEEYPESKVVPRGEFDELGTAGIEGQAIRALIQKPSEQSEFEPVGWIDVDEIIEQSRADR